MISLTLACAIILVGTAGVMGVPSVYQATMKIYATPNTALTATLASGRYVNPSDPNAMRGVTETVLSRSNLLELIRGSKVVDTWPRTRTWPLALKDKITAAIHGGPPSREGLERGLLELLQNSLWVETEQGSSIRFTSQWRDPAGAARLVALAHERFLAARSAEELGAIRRAIAVLEQQLHDSDAAIEPAVKDVLKATAKARPGGEAARAPSSGEAGEAPVARAPRPTATKPAADNVESAEKLRELRQSQRELLESWQRRKTELNFQLAELRTQYGPEHPVLRQQEAKLNAASTMPAELAALKNQENELLTSLAEVGAADGAPSIRRPRAAVGSAGGNDAVSAIRAALDLDHESPEVSAARFRLNSALTKSVELSARIDDARMQLATTEASFRYRYSVVEPVETPKNPIKPKRLKLILVVIVAGLLIGFLVGPVRELLSGKIVERWQVQALGIPVLGEIGVKSEVSDSHAIRRS